MTKPIVGIGEILWDLLPGGPRPGGAPFNFVFHCQQLGHPAVIVSRVGDDERGRLLRAVVRDHGLSDEFIQTDPKHPTGTVAVRLDAAGVPHYEIVPDVAYDYLEAEPRLLTLVEEARAVAFGTLAQRQPTSRNTIQAVLKHLAAWNICDLNLRPPFDDLEIIASSIQNCRWLKLSEGEWLELRQRLGLPESTTPAQFRAQCKLELLCVTKGPDGAWVSTAEETVTVPGFRAHAIDTVGAGDAFTAALLTQTLEGQPLRVAIRFANVYAAMVTTLPGAIPIIDRGEVERQVGAN